MEFYDFELKADAEEKEIRISQTDSFGTVNHVSLSVDQIPYFSQAISDYAKKLQSNQG